MTEETSLLSVKANSSQVTPWASSALRTSSIWQREFGSAEQNSRPTVFVSGNQSRIIWACFCRSARSDVPETLPPTVPLKSSMSSATP